jgi:hypothetical protein
LEEEKGAYPKVVVPSAPYFVSVSEHVAHKTRTEVTSQINSIASFPAYCVISIFTLKSPDERVKHTEASTDTEYNEEQSQRSKVASTDIAIILKSINAEDENRRSNNLGEELSSACQEFGRICAEDTRGRVIRVTRDSSDAVTTFEDIDCRFIVSVHDSRGTHATENLSDHVDGKFSPWEFAEDTIGKGNGWVQVSTRFTASVNTKHNSKTMVDC